MFARMPVLPGTDSQRDLASVRRSRAAPGTGRDHRNYGRPQHHGAVVPLTTHRYGAPAASPLAASTTTSNRSLASCSS